MKHLFNTTGKGFISSANQKPADTSYPYYLGRNYPVYRGLIINKKLTAMEGITPEDMMALQTNNYDVFAAEARPLFLKNIREGSLNADEKKYLDILKEWDCSNEVGSKGPTIFSEVWKSFTAIVFDDEFKNAPAVMMYPFESSLLDGVLRDSAYKFLDNVETPQKETLPDDVTAAFKTAVMQLKKIEADGKLEWAKYKGTHITHLTKLAPFSSSALPVGGGIHCINAAKPDHGPSWRMVISLTANTEAYGVYPAGKAVTPAVSFTTTLSTNGPVASIIPCG